MRKLTPALKHTLAAALLVATAVLTGGATAVLTGSAAPAASADAHRYWKTDQTILDARHACNRAGQPDLPTGTAAYIAWYDTLSASQLARWNQVFDGCQRAHPADFPADFHQVTREAFYGDH